MNDRPRPWWRNPTKLPFIAFLAIGAYFLWSEHQAHIVEFLPWTLVLACVGVHLFMHGTHGHRGKQRDVKSQPPRRQRDDDAGVPR